MRASIIGVVRNLFMAKLIIEKFKVPTGNYSAFSGGLNRLPESDRAWLPQKKDGSSVNVFPIFLAADNAKNFELSGLQKVMEATLKADQALVTTGLDHRLILHRLIVEIASARKAPARRRDRRAADLEASSKSDRLLEPLNLDLAVEEKEIVPGFTGALLLPAEPLIEMLGNKRKSIPTGELLGIKKRFGVAMSAVMMRARDTKIITDQTCSNFFRFGPAKYWRTKETRKEPGDDQLGAIFPETNFRFKQLVFRAYGEELITISQAASYLECSVEEAYKQLDDTF